MERVRPVGRIDYLSLSGKVCESCYHYSEAEFVKEVLRENDYGAPMVVNVFQDEQGDTIPLGFTCADIFEIRFTEFIKERYVTNSRQCMDKI